MSTKIEVINDIEFNPSDTCTYRGLRLPNKLKVLLVSDPTITTSAASICVKVGASVDSKEHQGLAHFLEHM